MTSNMFDDIAEECEIKVSSQEMKDWLLSIREDFSNIIIEKE